MNRDKGNGNPAAMRAIEEIQFQASMLALHAAIDAACKGTEFISGQDQAHVLVERVRRLTSEGA